ncbi:MAG: glutamate racemase, partial [Spirochaetaceae bacterium]
MLDSGIGGLPYLAHIRRSLPNEEYLYLSDREFFPYGEKHPDDLRLRLKKIVAWILQHQQLKVKAFVLACNTATVVGLEFLRKEFPDSVFVGVVPAIKPAARDSRGVVGVIATLRTTVDPYLSGLIDSWATHVRVETLGAGELVRFVEDRLYMGDDPAPLLMPIIERLRA